MKYSFSTIILTHLSFFFLRSFLCAIPQYSASLANLRADITYGDFLLLRVGSGGLGALSYISMSDTSTSPMARAALSILIAYMTPHR